MAGFTLYKQLLVLLTLSALQMIIYGRLLLLGRPDGELMECMMPPCQRAYPLWLSFCVFAGIGASVVLTLSALRNASATITSSAYIYGTIGIAVSAMAVDTHYMHPIPHAGVSLNPLFYSNVSIAQQALLPFGSMVISVAAMALSMIVHRAIAGGDAQARQKKS